MSWDKETDLNRGKEHDGNLVEKKKTFMFSFHQHPPTRSIGQPPQWVPVSALGIGAWQQCSDTRPSKMPLVNLTVVDHYLCFFFFFIYVSISFE